MNSKSIKNGRLHRTWLKTLIVVILITGIFFRFTNLDRKVYSFDESITSLRISGYTWTEMVQQDFQGKTISVEDLQRKYQQINPEKSWLDTVKGLATEEPQLPPLYFILARFWVQWFGPEVATVRSLSAWMSLFDFSERLLAVLGIISLSACGMDGCDNHGCVAVSRLVRARGKAVHDVCSPRLAVECNSAAGDRPTKISRRI